MSIKRNVNDVTKTPDLVPFSDADVSTRKCPYCAEDIPIAATVCGQCNSVLNSGAVTLQVPGTTQNNGELLKAPSTLKFCTNCGARVDSRAAACTRCGASPTPYKKFCHECGVAVQPEQIICVSCGLALPRATITHTLSASRAQRYCTNCGHSVDSNAIACTSCGASPRSHRKFCTNCGVPLNPEQVICLKCGAGLREPIAGVPARLLEHLRAQSLPTDPLQRAILIVGILVAMAIAIYPPWNISGLGFTRQLGHSWIWEPLTVNDLTAYIDLTRLCIYWFVTAAATTLALLWVKSR